MRDGYKIIDADAHFYEPPDIWDKYMVGEECYDERPRVAKVHGRAILQYTDGQIAVGGNRERSSQILTEKFAHGYNNWWNAQSRLEDMDEQGWDIQVILATNAAVSAAYNREANVYAAMCRAYNNWAHDYCSLAPERLKFCGQVPGELLDEMVVEMRRAVTEKGAVSIFLPQAIPDKMWHHPDYDPVWQAAVDLEVPLAIHGMDSATGKPLLGVRYNGVEGGARSVGTLIGFPFENMLALAHFMLSGILDRFPTLRLLVLESNSGWLPFFLNRLDKATEGRQGLAFYDNPLGATPMEYFLRQCAIAADADENTIKYVVDYIGNNNIVFNTDYPHSDAPAPHEPLQDMFAQPLSDESKEKILWDNSVKIYGERLIEGHPLHAA
jgi:predicted TIM-barrel fold metal-dependent hydrolase